MLLEQIRKKFISIFTISNFKYTQVNLFLSKILYFSFFTHFYHQNHQIYVFS